MNTADRKVITLGGRSFTLSPLPFEKNRVVVPACSFALKAMRDSAETPLNVTAIDYIYLAVFEAVSYADKAITRAEFNSWQLTLEELLEAMRIVAIQTGVLKEVKEGAGKKPAEPGELDWDEIIAYVCHNTGWQWDYVAHNVTMPMLHALEAIWEKSPPLAMSASYLAQYVGMKLPKSKTVKQALDLMNQIKAP